MPESQPINANVPGDWHILVDPEITIGNETKAEPPLLLPVSVQSWIDWEFYLMIVGIIVPLSTASSTILWKILRKKLCV
jgi:hypothetical protein